MATQRIQAFSITDTGRKRANNQDACAVFKKGDTLLMIVADGVGGNMCGEVASQLAVQTLRQRFEKAANLVPEAFLAQAASEANRNIRDYVVRHPECKGMATTLTAAIIRFPEIHLLQIGDSRAYLLREGSLHRLTEDHTLVGKMVKEGLLSSQEAKSHPKRHVIINALGISPEQKFDYIQQTLKPGDQVLLCSDGLYDEISEDTIKGLLVKNHPKEAIQRLVDTANKAGGKDNISITLAVLGSGQTAKTKLISDTRRFESNPQTGTRPNRLLVWLILLLIFLVLAGAGWYLGSSTRLGKKAREYITSFFDGNSSQGPGGLTQKGGKPENTD